MPDMIYSPIILVGAARSGTKFLRDCLGASAGTAVVPHDVNYIWRSGQQDYPNDCLFPGSAMPREAGRIRNLLKKQAKMKLGQRLIEKTVSNTLRVPFVDAIFPDAIFVHLTRDGREVTESAMRQWVVPPDRSALLKKLRALPLSNIRYVVWYVRNQIRGKLKTGRSGGAVWGPRYAGIDEEALSRPLIEVCAQQWCQSVQIARADLANIPEIRQHHIRYEDLVASPAALLSLTQALGLETEAVLAHWRNHLRPLGMGGTIRHWNALPEADKTAACAILQPILIELEYPL